MAGTAGRSGRRPKPTARKALAGNAITHPGFVPVIPLKVPVQ